MILTKELLLLEQINQWLGVLGNTYGVEVINLPNHRKLRTYSWLIWDDSRGNKTNLSQIHGGNLHLMHVNLEKVASFTKTYTSWMGYEEMLTKVSNTNLDVQHESWTRWKYCRWVQQQVIQISMKMEFHNYVNKAIALVKPKEYNGVCSRKQPRVRQHYEYRWFWFDLTIAHTQIKVG